MEILPLPHKPTHDLIEIPCLTTEPYDGGKFDTYPDREGWGIRTAEEWDRVFNERSKEYLAFLQRWLILGSLEVFLGRKIDIYSVTQRRDDPSNLMFSTAGLLPFLEEIYHSTSWNSDMRSEAVGLVPIRINQDLCAGAEGVRQSGRLRLNDFIKHSKFEDPRDPKEALFTTLLFNVLLGPITAGLAKSDTAAEKYLKFAPMGTNMLLHGEKSLLYQRMRDDGWCPSELSMIFSRLSVVGIYYVSHITRPGSTKEHPTLRILPGALATAPVVRTKAEHTESGKLCTKYQCAVNQLNELKYQTKHTEECHDCYDMVADPDEVFKILKNGRIPLIRSIDRDCKSKSIPLIESQPDDVYVAISHVWADGLGNLRCNALPRCQMLRLSQLIRTLPSKVSKIDLFWIDTIGCPPDADTKSEAADDAAKQKAAEQKEAQKEAQNWAISRMRQTYKDACAVLVLDSWLQQLTIKPLSDTEILTRIVCSAWNSRLWTLQEGALAELLYFQFADAQYDLDDGVNRLTEASDMIVQTTITPMIYQRVHEFRRFRYFTDRVSKVMALTWALKFRSTSMLEDEPICLATLLDLDVTQIIQIPSKDRMARMEKFWSLVGSIPPNLVFSDFPRLKTEGFRWAPATLLRNPFGKGPERTAYHEVRLTAKISPQGLLIKNSGLVIFIGRNPIPLQFPVMDWEGDTPYLIMCFDEVLATKQSPDGINSFNPWQLYGSEEICFIDRPVDKSMDFDPGFDPKKYHQNHYGILASISRDESNIIYVRYLCRAGKTQLWPHDPLNKMIIDRLNLDIRRGTHACGFNALQGEIISSALAKAKSEEQDWFVA